MANYSTMAPYGITPVANDMTKAYWDGAKEGKLMIQRCQACGYYNHPPQILCLGCRTRDTEMVPEQVSGKGKIYTWYICHDTSIGGYEDKVPYPVVYVELDEQPDLIVMSNILNLDVGPLGEGLEVGMPVEVVFDDAGDGVKVPQWQPVRR